MAAVAIQKVAVEIKKNDTVKVISGRDRGKQGRVLSVQPDRARLLVEHVNMVKQHTRRNPARQIKGGIAEREAPIAVGNVMIVCPSCGPVRIAHHIAPDGRKTRVCRKCGNTFDRK
ncbi:MAG: 50S ribosomal protein L24 [Acidobacteria bacterium]|nr:50S ribosomal protein L24 [Acidobacteriota bacterium]